MDVKVIFINELYSCDPENLIESEEQFYTITEDTTLQQLIGDNPDLSEYYDLSRPFSFNCCFLPYIINSKGMVEWGVLFENAKVKDFLLTHKIKNHTITAKVGYPKASGPGIKDAIEIWNMIYPILNSVVLIVVTGSIIKNAGKWVHSLFSRKSIPPHPCFDLIFSRKVWNHFELAKMLDITPDEAKDLIKLFGYKYDPAQMLFVQQPDSLVLKEKLSKIDVRDI